MGPPSAAGGRELSGGGGGVPGGPWALPHGAAGGPIAALQTARDAMRVARPLLEARSTPDGLPMGAERGESRPIDAHTSTGAGVLGALTGY